MRCDCNKLAGVVTVSSRYGDLKYQVLVWWKPETGEIKIDVTNRGGALYALSALQAKEMVPRIAETAKAALKKARAWAESGLLSVELVEHTKISA